LQRKFCRQNRHEKYINNKGGELTRYITAPGEGMRAWEAGR